MVSLTPLASVSRETQERFDIYSSLLSKWNPKINLVSKSTLEDVSIRHFGDSLQLLNSVSTPPRLWCDIGSGGGFPGLAVAIAAVELQWPTKFVLIESDQRKCAFLQTVSRETGVSVKIISRRIEEVENQEADIVSARALAPLGRLLPWILRHISADGHALLLKGRSYQQELEEVRDNFTFSLEIFPSRTDSESVALKLGMIRYV